MEYIVAGGLGLYLLGVSTGLCGALYVVNKRIKRLTEQEQFTNDVVHKVINILKIPN